MKNSIIVLIAFSLICVEGHSQHMRTVSLEGATISASLNHTYRNLVISESTPAYVQNLQTEAATYDIKKDPIYDKDITTYQVLFTIKNGEIFATYDKDGNVLSTWEKFKNITPPQTVRNSIYLKYPNWTFDKDLYKVSYYQGKGATKIYQLKLRKGNVKKNLKVNADGKFL
ncbi:hypothetical protein MWU78_08060 [Arenibacter sp. F26102]|uniref:hypothetical protein n=1 Tax=Arenibacter sp. F26102 TaxID=2926416 RepID=UPI001FF29528|nr:hypothetical protein [Arenibacter sp. F26102]MCK0145592.1 hypothetical protein [Arenibacter sp. F26102]